MKTKIIATKFYLTLEKELNKTIWVKKETEKIADFKTKKNAINYLKDMKKFTKKNFKNVKAEFTNANNYNEYMENWGCTKYYYKIVKA